MFVFLQGVNRSKRCIISGFPVQCLAVQMQRLTHMAAGTFRATWEHLVIVEWQNSVTVHQMYPHFVYLSTSVWRARHLMGMLIFQS